VYRAGAAVVVLWALFAPSTHGGSATGSSTAAQAVPSNQAATSAAAAVVDQAGVNHVFYRGQDGALYERRLGDGGWSAQTSLGGRIVGSPSATLAGSTLVVVARGTDGAVWARLNTAGTWGSWHSLGGVLSAAPGVVGSPDGRIDLFARGTDDRLWTRSRSASGAWSGWRSLGGGLASGPAAVSVGPDRIDVHVVGTDFQVWRLTRTGNSWSGWRSLGGRTYTAPTATPSPQGSGTWVFVRGTNDALYVNTNAAGGGKSWQKLGGTLIDAPAAAATAGRVDVVVRGTDNALWSRRFRNGTWSSWARAWVPAAPPAPGSSLLGTDWTRVPTTARVVALTFDAGANADALPSILRTLSTKKVPATFFLTGAWVRQFPAEANQIAVRGYLIGNHTDTHPDLRTLTDAQARAQVVNGQRAILTTTGAETRPLFRFPFGAVDARRISLVNGLGYVPVRWTVDSLGWQGTSGGMTVQRVVDRVLAGLQPGEIVLMHVGSHPTDRSMLDAAALPQIIDAIRARGYQFVSLSALTGQAQSGQ